MYLLCQGFALTVTRIKREQRRRAKGDRRGAEKLAKQQAAMVTMMRKKKKFAGNGNGFTWSQLPGFSLPITPTLPLSLSLSVSVSVCTSLCLLRLLRVALCGSVAYSFSLRYNNEACQNVSLSNKAGTLYQWHQLNLSPPLPPSRCLWLKNKKKVLNAVSVQLSN